MSENTDQFNRTLLIEEKEAELDDLNLRLVRECRKMLQLNGIFPKNEALRQQIREARSAVEDTLLTIRMTENDLHDLGAQGW